MFMLTLERVDPANLRRREEEYKKHLDLVATPHNNRRKLAELFRSRYPYVTPEHFEGAKLATGPGTTFSREYLQERYGIDGYFHLYPSTILVPRWDGYTVGFGPFQNEKEGLREELRTLGNSGGGTFNNLCYPKGSEMPIKLVAIETPHEDIHHGIRLVKGRPENEDQFALEELHAMMVDATLNTRTWDDAKWSLIEKYTHNGVIHPKGKELVDKGFDIVRSMPYLTPRGIAYFLLSSQTFAEFSRLTIYKCLEVVDKLPPELRDSLRSF